MKDLLPNPIRATYPAAISTAVAGVAVFISVAAVILLEEGGSTVLWVATFPFVLLFLERVYRLLWQKKQVNEFRHDHLFHNGPDNILICDSLGVVRDSSRSAARLFHIDQDFMMGNGVFSYIHKDDREEVVKVFSGVATKSHTFSKAVRCRILVGKSTSLWVECRITNLLQEHGVEAMVLNLTPMEHRIRQEKQYEAFLKMAVHEVKNPISAIKAYVQIMKLRESEKQNTETIGLIEKLENQVDRLMHLLDDMLNLAEIKSGALKCHFDFQDFGACVHEAMDAVRAANPSHHIILHTDSRPASVHMDKLRISQAIVNLLHNAIKYSPDSNQIDVYVQVDKQHVFLKVKDYGMGISKQKQHKIFERFYRANEMSDARHEGFGLGLYICTQIINKHAGRIGVNSEEGMGAEFWFSLPIREKALPTH